MHRFTILGPAWPFVRLLVQWGVLAFVFTSLVDLSIKDYPVFLLSGLVAWSWFQSGVSGGTTSLVEKRHLVLQPQLPAAVLPAVGIAVPLLDVLIALPFLLILVAATGVLHWTVVLIPLLLAIQFVLMLGIVWLTAAATVYVRDVRNVVDVAVTLLFYVTPVFYDLRRVPEGVRPYLDINPMTTLVDGWRRILIDGKVPDLAELALVAGASGAFALLAYTVFQRLSGGFADEL
jgi:lipopolysaccharide transport system permease protein